MDDLYKDQIEETLKNHKKWVSDFQEKINDGRITINFKDKLPPETQAEFIDDRAIIAVGEKGIQLPLFKNGHYLCRVMFNPNIKIGQTVDWSTIYEEMTGYDEKLFDKPNANRKDWHMVYDAVRTVNELFRDTFSEDLFEWRNKTVKRLR